MLLSDCKIQDSVHHSRDGLESGLCVVYKTAAPGFCHLLLAILAPYCDISPSLKSLPQPETCQTTLLKSLHACV